MIRLPAGRSSTSTPGSPPSSSASTSRSRPSPPGKSVDGDLLEVLCDSGEGLREAALDRRGELRAELLELVEASLEILALRLQVVEPLLLGLVLLARERVHLAERARRTSSRSTRVSELVTVVAFGRLDLACGLESPSQRPRLSVDPGDLDLRRGQARARLLELAAEVHLGRAERAELLAELAGPQRAGVGTCTQRRLEPAGDTACAVDPVAKRCRALDEPVERARVDRGRASLGARPKAASAARAARLPPPRLASCSRPPRPSAATSAASAERRPCSSSRTASAVSPTNQSSPRAGS